MIQINWQKYFKIKLSLIFFLSSLITYSQNLTELQNKYPDESEIALEVSEHYYITLNKKNEIEVNSNSVEDYLLLKNTSAGVSINESLVFSELNSVTDYEAYTIGNEAEKFKKTPVKLIVEKPYNSSSVFDSDTKLKVFTFSNLSQGTRKVLKHNLNFKDPMLLHRFNFTSGIPSVSRKIVLTVDKSIEIGYKIFNDTDQLVKLTTEENKKNTTYTFVINDAPIFRNEPKAAGTSYELPHLHFWISSYTIKGEKIPVFGKVEGLYKYYSDFIKNVNKTEDPALKKFTLELVKDAKTNDEKMEKIFKFAQDQIKYVAFESGYEGFIPRNASLVFERKFGDCKDMSSIMTEMAKYAEVPNVNLTWIGTRELPYSYEELPTPAVDNHMIATYERNGEIIFLDATDSQVPFGLPSEFIQGKETLISNGDSFKIVEVPTLTAIQNKYEDVYSYVLNGNKIEGKGKLKTNGLTRSYYLNVMSDISKNRKKYIESILERGNDKLNVVSFTENNIQDKTLPYEIEYSFENDNYVVHAGDETYLNMFLHKPFMDLIFDEERKTTADLDRLQNFEFKTVFKIPENTKVTYVPENVTFEDAFIKYKINFNKNANEILLNYTIENKKTYIKPSEVKSWNESLKKLKSNLNETIVIKKA